MVSPRVDPAAWPTLRATKSYADCSWGFLGDRPVCIAVGETDSTRQGTDDSFNGRLKKSEMATNSNK